MRLPISALERSFGVALAVLLGTSTASAQSESELASRRLLLEQAQTAQASGDHVQALDLATRAASIQDTPSVRLFIAEQQEALGRFADAFGSADLCVRGAERDDALRNRDAILERCRAVATRSRARLGYVAVRVPDGAAPGLEVRINGALLNAALWNVPAVTQPGSVTVEALRAGSVVFRTSITVTAGQTSDVTVQLQEARGATPGQTSVTPERVAQSTEPFPALPIATAAVGALGLVSAGVFFVLRQSALAGCDVQRDVVYCDAASLEHARADAPTYNLATNVALVGGGVLLAGGLAWLLVDRVTARHAPDATRALAGPVPGGILVGMERRF